MLEDMGRDELSLYDNISKRITARFNTLIRAGHVMK